MRTLALGLRKSGYDSLVHPAIDRTLGKTSEANLAVGPAVEHQQVLRFRGSISLCVQLRELLSHNKTFYIMLQIHL